MNILSCRSPYLRRALASNKKDNDMTHFKVTKCTTGNLSNYFKVSAIHIIKFNINVLNIFIYSFILYYRYIYGGIISLNEQGASDILKVLVAADKLLL